jgi:outer membrane protein OmpA-like peptidoglycan-associated protein
MSLRRMLPVLLVSAVALCAPSVLSAQSHDYPKVEIFGGYSWYHPGGNVSSTAGSPEIPDFNKGWGGQFTYNLNSWAGLALDAGGHYQDGGKAHTVTVGPQFRLRREHFTPFAEVLLGMTHASPDAAPDETDFALIAGVGLDYKVTPRFSIRPIQADYVDTYYNALSPSGDSNMLNGVRLQAGVVFNFGLPKEESAVSAVCSAQPSAVDAGAPVQVSVAPEGFLPKRILSYSYASTGGKISGNTSTATLDSTGLEAGSYTVTANITDNGRGKHQRTASCQTTFAVNAKHPPVLAITAKPSSLNSGDASTITADGSSPDNRPLTYSCTATAGSLSGSGTHYTLDTTGVPQSTITVNCTATDDRNLSTSASADVSCMVPAAPVKAEAPVQQPSKFGSIEFKRDTKRPTRVDNEAKGELDRYADALAAAPDSRGVVVGYATAKEDEAKKGKAKPEFAAQRAVNTKDYLTAEKGIDAARIEARTGSDDDQRVDLWVVPAGATFAESGTAVVDESQVKAVPRTAVKAEKAHKHATAN